jgi:uncharacterized protein YgbK (DUF1537 family)
MPVLVALADDFSGASDQAGMLANAGVKSLLVLDERFPVGPVWEAVTVATRLRSLPVAQARAQAKRLLRHAQALRPRMIQYKYCSTFDSTPEGNIGPILDVALDALKVPGTVIVPALPVNGRTTYQGQHFVLGVPLDESPMRHHPLNPMTDADLARWLGRQTKRPVGLVPYEIVEQGARAVRRRLEELWAQGWPYVVVDCLSQRHVRLIAEAVADLRFISGSSALPMELPGVWRERGLLGPAHRPPRLLGRPSAAPVLALSGSCAAQTLVQVRAAAEDFALIRVHPRELLMKSADDVAAAIIRRIGQRLRRTPQVLVTTSQSPRQRERAQQEVCGAGLAARDLGLRIETLLGEVARLAHEELGLRRFICAGGETSGAIAQALGLQAVEIIRELDPGVPLCRALPGRDVAIAFKGGNFGRDDFFAHAAALARRVRLDA